MIEQAVYADNPVLGHQLRTREFASRAGHYMNIAFRLDPTQPAGARRKAFGRRPGFAPAPCGVRHRIVCENSDQTY